MDNEFTTIIMQNQALIYKVCYLYCDSPADVDDLFQEIVVNLWQAFPQFEARAKVTTWMYRVALNTAITQLRRYKKRPPQQALDPTIVLPAPFQDDERRLLYMAIKRLNPAEKGIVTLYLDGFNYKEIAETVGISENYVGVRINRIKEKLREMVAE